MNAHVANIPTPNRVYLMFSTGGSIRCFTVENCTVIPKHVREAAHLIVVLPTEVIVSEDMVVKDRFDIFSRARPFETMEDVSNWLIDRRMQLQQLRRDSEAQL